jgi:hypothetical protein
MPDRLRGAPTVRKALRWAVDRVTPESMKTSAELRRHDSDRLTPPFEARCANRRAPWESS